MLVSHSFILSDEEANWGDVVEIRESRPYSRNKSHILQRIIKHRPELHYDTPSPTPTTYQTVADLIAAGKISAPNVEKIPTTTQEKIEAREAKKKASAKARVERKVARQAAEEGTAAGSAQSESADEIAAALNSKSASTSSSPSSSSSSSASSSSSTSSSNPKSKSKSKSKLKLKSQKSRLKVPIVTPATVSNRRSRRAPLKLKWLETVGKASPQSQSTESSTSSPPTLAQQSQ